jgi:hypothetical protein
VDFIAAFHLVSFFDFKDVFLIRAAVDQWEKYLAGEPKLNF